MLHWNQCGVSSNDVSMIIYVVSDLFESPARVLVNTVNTVGAMGKGLALQFRQFYPEMYKQYRVLCARQQFSTGQLWLYKTPHKWVLNFPTKADWRDPSRPEYLESGLQKFVDTYAEKGMTSVSFPMLGAGLGGLDWETMVRPMMERTLGELPINIYIHLYEPDNRFAQKVNAAARAQWLHGIPQIPNFTRFYDDLSRVLHGQRHFQTLDDRTPFTAAFDDFEERIAVTDAQEEPLTTLSQSLLADLWHFIHASGYCLPQHFPSGMDDYAPYVVALLSQLDYLRPVYLSQVQGTRQVGLHLIPPLADQPRQIWVTA